MYHLSDSLLKVAGIGPKTFAKLKEKQIISVKDLILYLPLRYEDRSLIVTIDQLQLDQINTVQAEVISVREYFKNRTRITNAVLADETGETKAIWFNNRFLKHTLKKGESYFFAGKYSGYGSLTQPTVEALKAETIHTGRLVPLYSQTLQLKQGSLRRILKEIIDHLNLDVDYLSQNFKLFDLSQTLSQLHFPDDEKLVIKARQRLAVEELLALMLKSKQLKQDWQKKQPMVQIKPPTTTDLIPDSIPFDLTGDQQKAINDIMQDLNHNQPMNRLLVGDVGSGKTVVAGTAAHHVLAANRHVCLVAPTQILAGQHQQTFSEIFPQLQTQLLTARTKATKFKVNQQPTLYIGTHAVINQLKNIQPALIIYDEQHRFGVAQRSTGLDKTSKKNTDAPQPHILTMSATPIPRSYMLTIFSHLDVSLIKELPFGHKPLKTWYVPSGKRHDAYDWIATKLAQDQTTQDQLALVVCPFINQSNHDAFNDVAAATDIYEELQQKFGTKLKIKLLHGQQKKDQQEKIIQQLFDNEINLLVSTSIVEVGVDLPQANIMVIEGADRFGLASLHQLRGRVGRQGQPCYCLLMSSTTKKTTKDRLKLFTKETDGLKLAELDLQNRGAGDLFGLQQHGLDNLRFASWTDVNLIKTAREIFGKIDHRQTAQLLFKFNQNSATLLAN